MSTDFFTIDTDEELKKLIQKLSGLPDQIASPTILAKALTAAARQVRTQIKKDVKKQYKISDTSILKNKSDGAPQVESARASYMTATIKSCGPMLDVMKFLTKPNTSSGAAAAQVLSSSSLKLMEVAGRKAFVTTFSNGHVAIVQRAKEGEYKPTGAAIRKAKYGDGADMTKIKKIISPAVPHMLGNEEVRAQAEEMAYSYLQAAIAKQIDKLNT